MHINLLNHNNIEGKGLSVLLGNEGHQVELIQQQEKRMGELPNKNSSSIYLINIDFLLTTNADQILQKVNRRQTVLLFGELSQLYWLAKISTQRKGFICKDSTFTDLLNILRGIDNQKIMLDRHAQLLLQKPPIKRQSVLLEKSLSKPLSNTELSLMKEISKGKTTKQIAQEQHLSVHTIYNHRKNIKQKFKPADAIKLSKLCMIYKEAIQTLVLISTEQFYLNN